MQPIAPIESIGTVKAHLLFNLTVEFGGGGVLLLGICEAAESIEAGFLNKFVKLGELLIGFKGEARYKGGAKGNFGDFGTKLFKQGLDILAPALAVHFAENIIIYMLKGYVKILYQLVFTFYGIYKLIGYLIGVGVKRSDPMKLFNFAKLT
jgi:hypothetical protein